jgi:zinc transporter
MPDDRGLVCAYRLDGQGGGEAVGWEAISAGAPAAGLLWLHLDYDHPHTRQWLEEGSGIDPVVVEALLADETRPRSVASQDGLLATLRGMNFNPGADPEDMVTVRLWVEAHRVISLRRRRSMAMQEVQAALAAGDGPLDAGGFLVEVAERLLVRMAPVLTGLDDRVDALEEEVLTASSYELRTTIGGLRREAIAMRRYLAPQRDAMARLQTERVSWLTDLHRVHLRELADRVTRYVEDLDSARDRAAVTQEELNSRISEQMNRAMYVLSLVAGIFLPLGLLTGLLGINVGGIPGTENHWAFAAVCGLLVLLATVQVWVFRRFRWI